MPNPPRYLAKLDGVLVRMRPGWSHVQTANGRSTFTASFASRDGLALPDLDADLVVLEGVSILSSSAASPSVITTDQAHGFVTGDLVEIDGHTGSTPAISGVFAVTRISSTTFSIPVAATVGGSGGYASRRLMGGTLRRAADAGWEGQGLTPILTDAEFDDYTTITERRFLTQVLTGASPAVPAYAFWSIDTVCPQGATITIGSRVYTFVTSLSNVDGYILIASTITGCLANLVAAIMGTDGAGTTYAAATTPHVDVYAVSQLNVLKVVARTPGTAGNSLAFTSAYGLCFGEGQVPLTTLARGAASSGTANTAGAVLAAIAVTLADEGVTVHPSQADLAEVPELSYSYALIQDVLNDLSGLATGAIWTLDSYRRLWLRLPATDPAPVDVTATNQVAIGDIEVERARATSYANRVHVRYSNAAQKAYGYLAFVSNPTDGQTVTLGSQVYTFKTALTDTAGYVLLGGSITESLQHLVAAITGGDGNGVVYAAKTAVHTAATAALYTGTILVAQALVAGAAGNSIAVATTWVDGLWYGEGSVPLAALARGSDQQLANVVTVNDLTEQSRLRGAIYEALVESAETTDPAIAQTIAETYLAASTQSPKTIAYLTKALGLRPGQSQTVNVPTRHLDGTFLITDVETQRTTSREVVRRITAIESLVIQSVERWQETYKRAFGNTGSRAASSINLVGGGGAGTSVSVIFLGGGETVWQQTTVGAWVAATSVQVPIDTAARGSVAGTCTVRLRAAAGSVTARLRDVTNGTTCGTSEAVSSSSFQTKSFPVVLTAGSAIYAIELSPSVADTDVQLGCGFLL